MEGAVTQAVQGPAGETDLSRLLEAEGDVAAMLGEARSEAERLVATAVREAAEREAGQAAELDRAAKALEASIREDRDARSTELVRAAEARAAAWDGIDDAALGRLADAVVAALLKGGTT